MKKFWLYNLLATLVALIVSFLVEFTLYGTPVRLYCDIALIVLLMIQFAGCGVYGVFHIKKHTLETSFLGISFFLFSLLVMSFIFTGTLWNTDTGTFVPF